MGTLDLPPSVDGLALLSRHGISPSSLEGIFLSHAHLDHYGALDLFPSHIPIVGGGTLGWVNGGDERGGLASFPSNYLQQGRPIIEMGTEQAPRPQKLGAFEEAYDWFGDGSFCLIKAEGG